MAVYRTLIRSQAEDPAPDPTLLPLDKISSSSPSPLTVAPNLSFFVVRLTAAPFPFFLPPSRWVPSSGPLFLCSNLWRLSQSVTRLCLRGKDAIFPRDLFQVQSFPVGLRLRTLAKVGKGLEDVVGWREKGKVCAERGAVGVDEKFLNLPNLVSISKMVSGPPIGWMIVREWYLPFFGALIVSGATDWLDGFLARKMGINSVLVQVLISCVALAMVGKDLLDLEELVELANLNATHREKVEPLFMSKVNTVFQLLLLFCNLNRAVKKLRRT